ncbi:hypothetical protein FC36_GL001462 [Ligilactobacillus equi DSM 15833 = JCM 10991]|uniref:Endolytic murein transglycosylase n=2 Tax=Ligilactobacillus equi TaxID=137357 RepID=A0A0R1TT33_9LACO|nr:endolytic transglycosylase MltG [Ligilactobacillus equi]KRL81650.1 hypothetical protein FC36_GL001462 [Ligilactobacillus equi DSM 15833 = JCM 10991]
MKKRNEKDTLDAAEGSSLPPRGERKATPKKARRIVNGVVIMVVLLFVAFCGVTYNYVQGALKPLHPNSSQQIQVQIPAGSTSKQIGNILEKKKIIKNGFVFDYYTRTKKLGGFKSGYYVLKPSMTLTQIAKELAKGGSATALMNTGRVVVREGATADQIGDEVALNTKYSKQAFLNLLNDESFLKELQAKYPELLDSAMQAKDVRYRLEGYLYPATYTASKKTTLKELVTEMVATTNQHLQPYYAEIKDKKYTVHEVLTMASLVEREGATDDDRRMIAGVFWNRIDKKMKLQTDVAVLYALGHHKEVVTYKDLEVDSPYNLYKYEGYGPGPYNNPSLSAIKATLNPKDRDKGYLYFVADIHSKKVYYSKDYDEHQKNVEMVQAKTDASKKNENK